MNIAPNTHNLEKRIEYALACLRENRPDLASKMHWEKLTVRMNTRSRRVAGVCRYWRFMDDMVIEFSEDLFNRMSDMDKTGTVCHEFAHAVCLRLGIDPGHGGVWKSVCKSMGGDGERVMNSPGLKVKRNRVTRHVYLEVDKDKVFIALDKMNKQIQLLKARGHVVGSSYEKIGVIECDPNSYTYSWVSLFKPEMRGVKVIDSDEWKLVG